MPQVSVVIPAYNAAAFLAATLDSVAAQTFSDVEVIVVDDGSTDDTVHIARDHPARPRVMKTTNGGGAVARNRGVLYATGEWVAFLDADDLWHREHLARALDEVSAAEASAISMGRVSFAVPDDEATSRSAWVDEWLTHAELAAALMSPLGAASEPARLLRPVDIATAAPVGTPSAVLVRREVLLAAGGFPSIFYEPTDVAAWFQVSMLTPFALSRTPTTYYRTRGGSLSDSSEQEVRALVAFSAMWYGNQLRLHLRDPAGLAEHGSANATYKLEHLLNGAAAPGEGWRLSVARAFETLLVRDVSASRRLRQLRAKRQLERRAPEVANLGRVLTRRFRGQSIPVETPAQQPH